MTQLGIEFRALLQALDVRAGAAALDIPPDWTQGRATFGGLVAALGLKAMRGAVQAGRHPRSLYTSFVAPLAPGEASLEVRLLREGRSASSAEARIVQDGSVRSLMVGSFGADRSSVVTVDAPKRPAMTAPDECPQLPYLEGITPKFTRQFAYRYALGGFPFSGSTETSMGGWCRFEAEREPATHEHILGLVDAWPPSVLPMMTEPAPGSSLDWYIQFLEWAPSARADDWWMYRAETDSARHGYVQARAGLWDTDGNLAALSTQTVTIFG